MSLQYHIKCDSGDVAPYVLQPGDPDRVAMVTALWEEVREVARNREYVTHTGTYKGVAMSCTSTGIGCPSTAIAMEELARVGARVFLRIGTCGTFQEHIKVGDIAVFDSAVRHDGASKLYVPVEYPAVADHEVVAACCAPGEELGYPYHVGTTRSADTFYAGHPDPGSSFDDFWQSHWRDTFADLKRFNVIAAEMEASIIFVLARAWGLRAGGISVVVDQVMDAAEQEDGFDPKALFSHAGDNITRLGRMGSETLVRVAAAEARQSVSS